jgi:hypothetical protein
MPEASFIMAMSNGQLLSLLLVVAALRPSDLTPRTESAVEGRYYADDANAEDRRADMIDRMCSAV